MVTQSNAFAAQETSSLSQSHFGEAYSLIRSDSPKYIVQKRHKKRKKRKKEDAYLNVG